MSYWTGYTLILIIGSGGLLFLLTTAHQAKRTTLTNILLVCLSLFLTGMASEVYFKLFFAESDSYKTLARENWLGRYYEGTFNSFGFRDQDWPAEAVVDKTKVMVVGDSFVEGFGINDPQDRFANILADKLAPNYAVFNLGHRGAGTDKEIKDVKEYPYEPDIMVWTYFINDIDGTARDFDLHGPSVTPDTPEFLEPIVENSYAINFAYWRIVRLLEAGRIDDRWQWRLQAFDTPEIWQAHRDDLRWIYEQTQAQGIPLIVVVFPDMVGTEESQIITQKIIKQFEQWEVPVLDVTPLIAPYDPADRVVNTVDPHPNELIHGLVGQALYHKFVELGLTEPETNVSVQSQ